MNPFQLSYTPFSVETKVPGAKQTVGPKRVSSRSALSVATSLADEGVHGSYIRLGAKPNVCLLAIY